MHAVASVLQHRMKTSPTRDYYSILGVEPSASQAAIREAYLARARVIHPDRFDQKTQPQDWKKANEMLAELNEAFATLRNPETRRQGDNWYGDNYLFGPSTSYSRAQRIFEFERQDNEARGYTISLRKVPQGDLRTEPIEPEEF